MTDDLNGVMRKATENLTPNIGALTSGGVQRGIRKRRNRRITQIAGAAASVTAVFGVVAMVGAPTKAGSATYSAAAGTTTTTPVAHPSSSAAKPPAKPAAPVSGQDMATWLEQTLQPYHFTGEQVLYKAGTNDAAGPYATLRIGYDGAAGSVSLNVARSSWDDQHINGTLPYVTVTKLEDGSHLMVFDGPEWPAGNGDPSAKRIEASWYRTDGVLVDVQVLNEVQEKGATTAPGLGLNVDQATKVVESPVWDKAIASVLAKQAPSLTSKTPGVADKPATQK